MEDHDPSDPERDAFVQYTEPQELYYVIKDWVAIGKWLKSHTSLKCVCIDAILYLVPHNMLYSLLHPLYPHYTVHFVKVRATHKVW